MTERTTNVIACFGWLTGCVAVDVLCLWYPLYVDWKYLAGTDSLIGMLYLGMMPFSLATSYVSAFTLIRLIKVLKGSDARFFGALLATATLLTVISWGPVFLVAKIAISIWMR